MNVTMADVNLALKNLNETSESQSYYLDKAYGGFLLMVQKEGGYFSKISTVRMSKHDIYYLIGAIENAIKEENRIRNLRTVQGI